MVLNLWQLAAKVLGTRHNIFDRLQLRHIKLRFHGHGQVGVSGAQHEAFIFRDGPAYAAFTPVVGGQRQMPIAKHAVEFLQIVQGRARGGQHVAPVVPEHVLFELKSSAGGGHELPHARGFRAGYRLRVERAFDKGQQGQLRGHVAKFQFLDDVEKVLSRPLGHPKDVVWSGGVPVLAVVHQRVV